MAKVQRAGRASDVLRVSGALVATLPVAVLAALCVATRFATDVELGFMLGLTLAIPLWVSAMCAAFLARGGGRVWIWCAAAAVVFGVISYGVPL